MRPLKLVVQGFKPFKERQEIDFSRLEFFVIRGPTGSGKSSILDAIGFALFGNRWVKGKNFKLDLDELINRNSSRFLIDFTFSVGGKIYRITRERKRGQSGEPRFYENNVRKVVSSTSLEKEIKQILGVDAEQFRKIFFLPQGRYAEFFSLEPAKRQELLISLLDLTVYDELTEKLKERLTEVEREISNLEGRLTVLADATPRRLEELQREFEEKKKLLKEVKEKLSSLEGELNRLRQLSEKVRRKGELKAEIEKLLGGEYLRLKGEVEALKPLKGLLPYLQEFLFLEGEIDKLRGEKEGLLRDLEGLNKALHSAERELENLQREEEEFEKNLQKVEKFRKLLGFVEALKPLYAELSKENKTVKALKAEMEKLERTAEGLRVEIETLSGKLEELNRRLEENPYSPEAETNLRLTLQRCAERDRLLSELRDLKRRLKGELEKRKHLLEELKGLGNRLLGLERELEERRKGEREYLVYLLVKDLKEGDPCPVCGRPIEKLEAHFRGDFDIEALRRLEEEREKLLLQKGELEKRLAAVESGIENLQRRVSELEHLLEDFEDLPPTAEVERTLKTLLKAKGEREHLEREIERVKNLLEEKRRLLASAESSLEEKAKTLKRLEEDLNTKKAKLREDLIKVFKEIGERPPKGVNPLDYLEGVLRRGIETLEGKRKELENRRADLERKLSTLQTRLEERRKLLKEIERKLSTLGVRKGELLDKMVEMGLRPSEDLKGLYERLQKLPEMEGRVEAFEREIAALRAELETLERELKDINPEWVEEKLTALEEEYQTLKGEEETLITRLGALKEGIETLRGKLEEREKLERELENLRRQHALLKTVREDFKADKLMRFVVDRAMTDIVELAGEYLYKLSERYRFELEEGKIKVEDQFMGAVRDVKTLSGGETFLASLSFALALGDYIGKGASVESLFIDEGFGTLDREKLDRIGELFEKLRHSVDKVVGIITHLDELAFRFDQRIEVIPSPNGSKVKVIV